MTLPDIPTSVAFWAGVATLLSAAGAWFTFAATVLGSRRETYQGIRNLLVGLNAELDLISQWASGGEGDRGYVLPQDLRALTKEQKDWFNPSRYIFTLETPTLQNLTRSQYIRHLNTIVQPLVKLNYSFRRLFDFHADFRAFVNNSPVLYTSVFKKLKDPQSVYLPAETDFMNFVFGMNHRMHNNLIGGEETTDELCLYKAFRSAKSALAQFEVQLHAEPLPWWFWIFHVLAACLTIIAAWQVLRWFSIV
ncbi:MAG TPA: hypothetical protein VMU53_05920 [Candidatus Sulfotelmatobacter sp.]|nr:hypothetical protein [Candidatus Sulfotelmatobacter sp.]